MNALGENSEKFTTFEHPVGAFPAGHDSTELPDEVANERKFQQAGMSQKARNSSRLLDQLVKGHDAVPGHETTMHPDQDSRSFARNVLQPDRLDTPVVIAQELEQRFAEEPDVVRVHPEFIKCGFRRRSGIACVAAFSERRNT